MASVEFEGVSHRRPGDFGALVRFDLVVDDGETVALVGTAGSGATTALHLLAGFEHPDAGRIRIAERDITGTAPRDRRIALVLPHDALTPRRTVRDHLDDPLVVDVVPASRRRRRVDDVAERLSITEALDRLPYELSPAERQRVAFGRAVIRRPTVLLINEPWARLVGPERVAVRNECARWCSELGVTVLTAVRALDEAAVVADRLVRLARGAMVLEPALT